VPTTDPDALNKDNFLGKSISSSSLTHDNKSVGIPDPSSLKRINSASHVSVGLELGLTLGSELSVGLSLGALLG